MKMTNRDRELLSSLQRYGCLTTKQVAEMHFRGIAQTTTLRRLRALSKDHYVQRILGLESAERLWALTKKSALLLEKAAKLHFPRVVLEHESTLTELRLMLESTGLIHSWIPEHEIRASVSKKYGIRESRRRVIPDALIGVSVSGIKESVALELELSPKNQNRYKQILYDYSTKSTLWGVWYVTGSRTLEKQIRTAQRNAFAGERGPKILFTDLQSLLDEPLLARVRGKDSAQTLTEIFKPKDFVKGAHPHDHRVSGLERAQKEINESVTTELNN